MAALDMQGEQPRKHISLSKKIKRGGRRLLRNLPRLQSDSLLATPTQPRTIGEATPCEARSLRKDSRKTGKKK